MKMYDKITSPAREGYKAPPMVKTGGPGTWMSKPPRSGGIPGASIPGEAGASIPGPTGPAPKIKV